MFSLNYTCNELCTGHINERLLQQLTRDKKKKVEDFQVT